MTTSATRARILVVLGPVDPLTREACQGLSRGITAAGYEPYQIQAETQATGETDRFFESTLQSARLVVVDLTATAQGRVYHQAGWAVGLGIPVVYTCHATCRDHVHRGI